MSDPEDIVQRARALAEKATGGKWKAVLENDPRGQPVAYYRSIIGLSANSQTGYLSVVADGRTVTEHAANAEFIAAARELVPALCDEVERLRHVLATDREVMRQRKLVEFYRAKYEESRDMAAELAEHLEPSKLRVVPTPPDK